MADARRPPERFLIPVVTLGVPRKWRVGNVIFHPGRDGEQLLADAPAVDDRDGVLAARVVEILRSANAGSIAEVRGVYEIDDAIDAVRMALDALRLFQLSRRVDRTTSFGLPGDLYESLIEYVAVWERSAPGGRYRGDFPGWSFDEAAVSDWLNSSAFRFLDQALRNPRADEGSRRAVVGTQLFSRAAAEHQAGLKMIGIAAALEAWLLERQPGGQTLRLARHVAWFGCGRHDASLCGRARPICPYLRLSPDNARDRKRLSTLSVLGATHVSWRCSEWHRVTGWYDARSGAAHGDPSAVDAKTASSAEFWVARYLAEPILEWLRSHPADPIEDLTAAIDLIDEPARWQDMLDALDSPAPPAVPPL